MAMFYDMDMGDFEVFIKAYEERQEEQMEIQDALNHLLGRYIGYAVNDPKKYPKKPFLHKKPAPKVMTSEAMERIAKNVTIKNGGTIKA